MFIKKTKYYILIIFLYNLKKLIIIILKLNFKHFLVINYIYKMNVIYQKYNY